MFPVKLIPKKATKAKLTSHSPSETSSKEPPTRSPVLGRDSSQPSWPPPIKDRLPWGWELTNLESSNNLFTQSTESSTSVVRYSKWASYFFRIQQLLSQYLQICSSVQPPSTESLSTAIVGKGYCHYEEVLIYSWWHCIAELALKNMPFSELLSTESNMINVLMRMQTRPLYRPNID